MMSSKIHIDKDEILKIIEDIEINEIEIVDSIYISDSDQNHLYTVGCTLDEKYFKIPEIGKDIIHAIQVQGKIDNLDLDLDVDVDLRDFLINLINMGLIKRVNDYYLEKKETDFNKRIGLKLQSKIFFKPYTNIIFNKVSICLMLILLIFSIYIKYVQQRDYGVSYIPNVQEFFLLPNLLLLTVVLYLSDLIFGLYHETSHVLTARHFGVKNVNINLGRRLIHLVYQTQIPNIWSLPKKKRYMMYISGMIADIVLIAVISIVGHYFLSVNQELLFYISRILVLTLLLGILFELKLYMRTDIYYLISDGMDKPNLHQDAVKLLKNLSKEWKKADKKLRTYLFLMVGSSFIEVFIFLNFLVPFFIYSIKEIGVIRSNYPSLSLNDYGTLIAFSLIIIELAFLIAIYLRERLNKREVI